MIHHDRHGHRVLCASADAPDGRKSPKSERSARKNNGPWSFGEDQYEPPVLPQGDQTAPGEVDLLTPFPSHAERHSGNDPQDPGNPPGELQILEGISLFKTYLLQQRDYYRPKGASIRREFTDSLRHFFTPRLLNSVRVLELHGERIPNPPFYPRARALGFAKLPDVSHQASLTFMDVVVFSEKLEERKLFHALVHTVQVEVLGLDRYAELSVRGFAKKKSYFMVPLKAHAFALDLRFAVERGKPFSVEEEVHHWARVGLY